MRYEGSAGRPGDLDGDGTLDDPGDYAYVDPVDGWTNRPKGQIEMIDRDGGKYKFGPDEDAVYTTMGINKFAALFGSEQSYNLLQRTGGSFFGAVPRGYPIAENHCDRGLFQPALALTVSVGAVDASGKRAVTFTVTDLDKWRALASGLRLDIVQYDMDGAVDPKSINEIVVASGVSWDSSDGVSTVQVADLLFARGSHRVMVRLVDDKFVGGATGSIVF